jgi:hypothetical protein
MKNYFKELTTEEITNRIYNSMIYIFECKKTLFADVYAVAAKSASEIFCIKEDTTIFEIASNVARRYTDTHGQPSN